jgi:hypothetical protein
MISEFLRKFPFVDPTDVDGVDYGATRLAGSFFFPQHDEQRHFKEENCYFIGDEKFTNGEDWHAPMGDLSYRVNSHGFHGTEFVQNPDLLCAGCSVTVGFGLSFRETWPHILRDNRYDTEYVNVVGEPGASISKIVYMVFSHIDRFGWPKEIHLCLPDIHRGWVQVRRGGDDYEESAIWYDPDTANFFTHEAKRNGVRIESPDGTDRQPPLAMIVRENMMALDMLSLVSWATGIPLVLSTYAASTHKMMLANGVRYPGYAPLHKSMLDSKPHPVGHPTDCCMATPEDFCWREEVWTYAFDGVHPGFHSHIHLAEAHLGSRIV